MRLVIARCSVDYDGRQLLQTARMSNLSQNGCFVATPKPLPVGAQIELRFQIPGVRELLCIPSTVRWSRGSPPGQRPVGGRAIGMGIEFDRLTRTQRAQVRGFIKRFIAEMRAGKK